MSRPGMTMTFCDIEPRYNPRTSALKNILVHAPLDLQEDSDNDSNDNVPDVKIPPPISGFKPRLDLYEDRKANIVTVILELPGMRREGISIDMRDEKLYISGERVDQEGWSEDGFSIRERPWGKFKRVVLLPKRVKSDEVKARFDNGLLTITFPMAVPQEAPSKITIDS